MKREVNDNKELSKQIAKKFIEKTGNDTSYYFKLNIKNMAKKQIAIIGVPNFFKDSFFPPCECYAKCCKIIKWCII